jgi:nucleotide-binding universal stress UspA family protein
VVVGVDGSETSLAALEFAAAEAAVRGTDLVALHTWFGRLPEEDEQELPLIYDAEDVRAEQARRLAGWVAATRPRFPAVPLHERVRAGRPARTLLAAAATAQLVVVGARGRGGFTGLLLGSVSQALLHHADCPVAVIRATPAPPDR